MQRSVRHENVTRWLSMKSSPTVPAAAPELLTSMERDGGGGDGAREDGGDVALVRR